VVLTAFATAFAAAMLLPCASRPPGARGPFPEDEDRLSGKLLRQEYHLMCR